MRWSAVFAGTVLAIGLWILLQVLGMGIGLSAVDTDDAGNLRGIGIGTGIWSLIAPLIAMFVGAVLAGRLAGTRDRKVGAMHGSVMWALAIAVGLWAMLSLVSALASGAARVGGAAASVGSSVISGAARAGAQADGGDVMSALGVDTDDFLAQINQRLEREGKPRVTSEQLQATIRAVAQRGVREGKLDRQALVEELARNTALTRADAEDIANQIAARYDEAAARVSETAGRVGERAKTAALTAADRTGKALLFGGLMMLGSLAASLVGGALGVPRLLRGDGGRGDVGRSDVVVRTETTEVPTTLSTPGLMGRNE